MLMVLRQCPLRHFEGISTHSSESQVIRDAFQQLDSDWRAAALLQERGYLKLKCAYLYAVAEKDHADAQYMREGYCGRAVRRQLEAVGCHVEELSMCRNIKNGALQTFDVAIIGDDFDEDTHQSVREELRRFACAGKGLLIIGCNLSLREEYYVPIRMPQMIGGNVSLANVKEGSTVIVPLDDRKSGLVQLVAGPGGRVLWLSSKLSQCGDCPGWRPEWNAPNRRYVAAAVSLLSKQIGK